MVPPLASGLLPLLDSLPLLEDVWPDAPPLEEAWPALLATPPLLLAPLLLVAGLLPLLDSLPLLEDVWPEAPPLEEA
ncbi:MAG: hypothetical protein WDM94_03550 [Bauldia sp.]